MNDGAWRHGVGVMVVDAAGACVFMERRGAHGAGTWGLPGGKVEDGESIAATAVREALEEIGVSLDPDDVVVGPWTLDRFADAPSYVTHYARCRIPAGQRVSIRERGKCSAVGVFKPALAPGPLFLPLQNLRAKGMFDVDFAERTESDTERLRKEISTAWTPAIR